MIIEDYVSFEIAKLLKKKGFDENVISFYPPGDIQRPTLQMAMKWLREVHNMHIDICSIWDVAHWIYQVFVITPRTAHNSYVDKILYTSYEQAVEAGIKYCLENLI